MEAQHLQPGTRFRKPGTDTDFNTVKAVGAYGNPKKNILYVDCEQGHSFILNRNEELEIEARDVQDIDVKYETV